MNSSLPAELPVSDCVICMEVLVTHGGAPKMTFGCCYGEVHVQCGLRCYQTGTGCPLCRAEFHPDIKAAFQNSTASSPAPAAPAATEVPSNPFQLQEIRNSIRQKIFNLLMLHKTDNQEYFKKVPRMSQRLEQVLYSSSRSLDEYANENTIKDRIRNLALNVINQ
jgi:hypothetical protein